MPHPSKCRDGHSDSNFTKRDGTLPSGKQVILKLAAIVHSSLPYNTSLLCTDYHLLLAGIAFSQMARPEYPWKCHINMVSLLKKKKWIYLSYELVSLLSNYWKEFPLNFHYSLFMTTFSRTRMGNSIVFHQFLFSWWNKIFLSKTFVQMAYNGIEYFFLATSRIKKQVHNCLSNGR